MGGSNRFAAIRKPLPDASAIVALLGAGGAIMNNEQLRHPFFACSEVHRSHPLCVVTYIGQWVRFASLEYKESGRARMRV